METVLLAWREHVFIPHITPSYANAHLATFLVGSHDMVSSMDKVRNIVWDKTAQ